MMLKLWVKDGKLMVDSQGRPILCETCPCETCDLRKPLKQRILMTWFGYHDWWVGTKIYDEFDLSWYPGDCDAFLAREWTLAETITVANSVAHRYLKLPIPTSFPASYNTHPPRETFEKSQTNSYCNPTIYDGGWVPDTITCEELRERIKELYAVFLADTNYPGGATSVPYISTSTYYQPFGNDTFWEGTPGEDGEMVYVPADLSQYRFGGWGFHAKDTAEPISWQACLDQLPDFIGGISGPHTAGPYVLSGKAYYLWQQSMSINNDDGTVDEMSLSEWYGGGATRVISSIWDANSVFRAPWDAEGWARPPACAHVYALWGTESPGEGLVVENFENEFPFDGDYHFATSINMDGSFVYGKEGFWKDRVSRMPIAVPCRRPALVDASELVQVDQDFWTTDYNLTGSGPLVQWVESCAGYLLCKFEDIPSLDLPCDDRECDYPYPYPYPY